MRKLVWGNKKNENGNTPETPTTPKEEYILIPSSDSPSVQMMGPQVVEVVENTVYFYADIDRDNILKLNKTIHELNNNNLWRGQITSTTPAEIYLHINSFGGVVFDAFSVVDSILDSKIPINTVIDGCAASAATFLSIVGHKRYIKKHSVFLIHQISSSMWGKYSEFQDEIQNLDKIMAMIKELYRKHTKIKMSTLNEILKRDLWFSAKDAISMGLVDGIFGHTDAD